MFLAPISDIIGRRTVIISLSLVGVSMLLKANAATLGEFILLRFVNGMGAGAILACQIAMATEYPDRYRAIRGYGDVELSARRNDSVPK